MSAGDMFEAVRQYLPEQDIIVKCAAVADYTPPYAAEEKIKKADESLTLELVRTTDILAYIGENKKEHQFVCGFSMETEHMLEHSRAKLQKKKIDMIAANNLKVEGAGFGHDTNVITIITKEKTTQLPLQSKKAAADSLLDMILAELSRKGVS